MISEKADKMTDFLVGASVAYGRSNSQEMHVKIGEAVTQLHTYIAELEAKKDILENQLREATNFLIDKKLHVDSLYEDGFKLQKRIAELEVACEILRKSNERLFRRAFSTGKPQSPEEQ